MGVWDVVAQLIDRTGDVESLRLHRLHLLAARRWEAQGRALPASLRGEALVAAMRDLAVPAMLERIRDCDDGPLVLLKGPVVAALYPHAGTRPFLDLDVLVRNPGAVRAAMLNAGWTNLDDPTMGDGQHHVPPLVFPGLPLGVELHSRPHWPAGLACPSPDAIFEAAAPGAIDGVLEPDRAQHALIIAAHGWAHGPLLRVGDLLDTVVVAGEVTGTDLDAVAREWGCTRLWRTTARTADGLLGGGRVALPARIWARHLGAVRDRTVLERHVADCLGAGWSAPRRRIGAVARAIADDALPGQGEAWRTKLVRVRRAVGHARRSYCDYESALPFEERHPMVVVAAERRAQNIEEGRR